jgi:hypothetical protein
MWHRAPASLPEPLVQLDDWQPGAPPKSASERGFAGTAAPEYKNPLQTNDLAITCPLIVALCSGGSGP